MAFSKVGELLTKRHHTYDSLHVVIDSITILGAWPSIIESINCIEKFERTRAVAYRNRKLRVLAASNTVASELRMCEQKIIAAYTKRFKTPVVEKLLIRRG